MLWPGLSSLIRTCQRFSSSALTDNLESANQEAADHMLILQSTLSNLDSILIGLIVWSVALTLAVTVMVIVIVRRMWMIHTLSKEIAARSAPTPESEGKEKVVINVDGSRLSRRFSSRSLKTAVQAPVNEAGVYFPDPGTSTS